LRHQQAQHFNIGSAIWRFHLRQVGQFAAFAPARESACGLVLSARVAVAYMRSEESEEALACRFIAKKNGGGLRPSPRARVVRLHIERIAVAVMPRGRALIPK
jgi:hypothetical protein